MPLETATATAPAVDPKQTSANIAKGVTDRAGGKGPATNKLKGPETPADGDEKGKPVVAADPNAGKRKFIVEGRDVWLTPEQMDAYVQKGVAFEPKMSELARMRQEMVQFERALLDNPGVILANIAKKTGTPIQTLVEKVLSGNASDDVKEATGKWYWENVAKRHQMDPKDLAILERDERIKNLEQSEQAKAAAAIAEQNRSKVQRALAEVSGQINETIKELGLGSPDSALGVRLTKEIADVMRMSYLSKKPCTPKQAAEIVRSRMRDYQKQFYDGLDQDKLVEELGKENAEKVRKHFLKMVKEQEKDLKEPSEKSPAPRRGERKVISPDEFHDYLQDLKKNGK